MQNGCNPNQQKDPKTGKNALHLLIEEL